jgi:hypothetical protein
MSAFKQVPDRYLAPARFKDYYQSVYGLLNENGTRTLLDIGTASGDFLYFLPDQIRAVGLDSSLELINEANRSRKKPNLEFRVGDFESFSLRENFDAITILGTLVTVDDWKVFLVKCLQMQPKLLVIHDVFNPEPIDIRLGFKDSSSDANFNFGYNIVSVDSLIDFFNENQLDYKISEFQLKTDLFRDLANPMYNYHANFNGSRVLTNGTGLVLRMFTVAAWPH